MEKRIEKLFMTSDETEAELIRHGISILICDGRGFAGVLLCALFLKDVKPALYYITVFGMFRTACGGWHAESEKGCFAVYVALYLVCYLIRRSILPAGSLYAAEVLSACYILANAPVQHIFQPLYKEEVRRCRIRAGILLGLIFIVQNSFLKTSLMMNTVILLYVSGSMELLKHTRYWGKT